MSESNADQGDPLDKLPRLIVDHEVRLTRVGSDLDSNELFNTLTSEVWEHVPGGRPVDAAALRALLLSKIERTPSCATWLIYLNGAPVGTTSHFGGSRGSRDLEIGATYMAPSTWGTGLNARVKNLMITAARESGAKRVLFQTDERNVRSARAILKLGATPTGTRLESIIRPDGTQRTSLLFELSFE